VSEVVRFRTGAVRGGRLVTAAPAANAVSQEFEGRVALVTGGSRYEQNCMF